MRRQLLAALVVFPTTALAAFLDPPQTPRERCDPVEYAELAAMERPELTRLYCDTSALAERRAIEAATAAKMARAVGGPYVRQSDAFARYSAACREQTERLRATFSRRFGTEPACDPPK